MQSNGKIFWASFLTLIAAGIGFSVRGAILNDWSAQFGFTQGELDSVDRRVTLSANVLRVETAALTAAILLTQRHVQT